MKELLKRELNKTYLILNSEDENYEESYEIEMILRNSLSTLLPFHVFRMDGVLELNYDISAKQNLKSCAEKNLYISRKIEQFGQTRMVTVGLTLTTGKSPSAFVLWRNQRGSQRTKYS